jgi:hypothetical protein
LNLRPPGYEPPRFRIHVPPYSVQMQARSPIRPSAVALGGTRLHQRGSAALAECLQPRRRLMLLIHVGRFAVATYLSSELTPSLQSQNVRKAAGFVVPSSCTSYSPEEGGRVPTLQFPFSRSEGAVAGARHADKPRRTGGNELDHDIHQGGISFVPDDVHHVESRAACKWGRRPCRRSRCRT